MASLMTKRMKRKSKEGQGQNPKLTKCPSFKFSDLFQHEMTFVTRFYKTCPVLENTNLFAEDRLISTKH